MEQSEAIWDAKLAGSREDAVYRILLYRIDNFYVEVFYHKEHNVIKKFHPFNNKQELQPYQDVSS
jgi:hypothetical protein